jgi:rifampicin phosphotransferase
VELERFLEEFGHRGVYEAELMNPRWCEDPSYILEQVRYYLNAEAGKSPGENARALRKQAETEVRRLALWRRPWIRWLTRRLQQGMALREAAKSAMGFTAEPSRRVLLEVGRRLAVAGNLNRAADIFHLSSYEIQSYLQGDWDGAGARDLAADRIAQREFWLTQDPPDVITTDAAVARVHSCAPALKLGQTRWAGLGVAPGQARGECRIIRHPLESGSLKKGEILIAPSTDPGWTPLCLRAGGIVMETGGYLSHGAIVAREYGIPAVVNIPGLLKYIRNGEQLLVDGDRGMVEKVG